MISGAAPAFDRAAAGPARPEGDGVGGWPAAFPGKAVGCPARPGLPGLGVQGQEQWETERFGFPRGSFQLVLR